MILTGKLIGCPTATKLIVTGVRIRVFVLKVTETEAEFAILVPVTSKRLADLDL